MPAAINGKRIGELLSQLVPLSGHDIEEILHEQSATRKPFGDIALAMGLCRPEHVWKAWCGQLLIDASPRRIDLDRLGIDAQATSCIPQELASRLNIVPVRVLGDLLIVATSERSSRGRCRGHDPSIGATTRRPAGSCNRSGHRRPSTRG